MDNPETQATIGTQN